MKETFETIFLLASIQGVLLSIVIFLKKANHSANILLSLVIFALSMELLTSVYYSKGWYLSYIHFSGITYPIALTYGPLFYFYAKILTGKQERFETKNLLHFLPILAVYIIMLPVFFYPTQEKISFVQKMVTDNQPFIYDIIEGFVPLQGLFYTALMVSVVAEYNRKIKDSFSNIDKINLDWLKYLTFGMIFCWSIVGISHIAGLFFNTEQSFTVVLHIAISIIIYSVGYLSLNQPEIFLRQREEEKDNTQKQKYKKSGLDESSADGIKTKLIEVMENQKPFIDSDLTLIKLADLLSISEHNLSEVINSKLNKTYYDFINEYRVEEFINKLKDPSTQNYNLISIAFDSGFKSKTSFNSIFKKHTGKTPSEFKKSMNL